MPAISISAPGKIILCGEHAVVYGTPAIALPVFQVSTNTKIIARPQMPQGEVAIHSPLVSLDTSLASLPEQNPLKAAASLVMVELGLNHIPACDIYIESTLPLAAGMGSSASVTVSLVKALATYLGHPLEKERINHIAYEVEKIHHGSPSGIDNTVITYENPVFFQRGKPIEQLCIARPFTLIIADTGIKGSTSEAVTGVRQRWEVKREQYQTWFDEIGAIVTRIKGFLEKGTISQIGSELTRNHELLRKIGVSCPELNALVDVALDGGAMGAKLSGGGLGGNMIALVNESNAANVAALLASHGAVRTIVTTVPINADIGALDA